MDRNRPEFNPSKYNESNPIQLELVYAFKERIGAKWISSDRDIYFSIHYYYDKYQERINKGRFRGNN